VKGGLHSLPDSLLVYVRLAALNGTCAPSSMIREEACAVVVELACSRPFAAWPELFPHILRMVESPSPPEVEGAFAMLVALCGSVPSRIQAEVPGRPLRLLVPKLTGFLSDPGVPLYQLGALGCLSCIFEAEPLVVVEQLGELIPRLTVRRPRFLVRILCASFLISRCAPFSGRARAGCRRGL